MYKIVQTTGGVCASEGFFADGVSAGLKPENAKDMAFIYSETECAIASVFTTNKMAAAPIKHFKAKGDFKTNFILINSIRLFAALPSFVELVVMGLSGPFPTDVIRAEFIP